MAVAALFFVPLWAGHAQPSGKVATSVRISGPSPRIDGRLDDAVWTAARPLDDFVQLRPIEGAAPSERTIIFVMHDDEALYIGARLLRSNPDDISRTVTRRDGGGNAERLTVTLDPQRDRRTGVGYSISAAGVRSDHRHTRDARDSGRESQYDPVWTAGAEVNGEGWTAEMRIPFSQLRFPPAAHPRWGLQIERWMPDRNEDVQWVLIPQNETGFISRFATLEGLGGVRADRPIELVPYVAGDATRRATATASNPLVHPYDGRVGVDAKFAVGSSLTLDATVNPDFGQVEADPAEVNLSAFETFFDERRPFFTEGSELLRGSGAQYFYSRRIGAPPHVGVEGDFTDMPRASTILGAAKLTGRLPSRLSVGGLLAVTAAEHGRAHFIDSAVTRRHAVEPRTAYGMLRLQQEIGSQASTLGAAVTAVRRDFGGEERLSSFLTREAYYAGTDWRLRFQQGKYAITGFAGVSHVAGDTGSIQRLQASSARFLQRPDATHLRFDPTRTSLTGYTASLRADKDAGRHVLWGAQVTFESPEYEVNDFGRLSSTDDIEYNADIQFRETQPGTVLQNWQLGFETNGGWNYAGMHLANSWTQNTSLTFRNFWNLNLRTTLELPTISDALTRGGPYMANAGERRHEVRLQSASGARTGWRVSAFHARDQLDAARSSVSAYLILRPQPRWSLSLEPNYQKAAESRQYVTQVEGGTNTFGTRYVFAWIDRTTISTRVRLNYAFSPSLTLEGYAEPFLASGVYSRFGELAAPRRLDLRAYGTNGTTLTVDAAGNRTITDGTQSFSLGNPDFHVRSFRSNMVMRWEWNPGSTLFLVWQQNRRTSESLGDPVRYYQLFRTARVAGDNFLSLKLSYWLPIRL